MFYKEHFDEWEKIGAVSSIVPLAKLLSSLAVARTPRTVCGLSGRR